jgi:hypothetical protein
MYISYSGWKRYDDCAFDYWNAYPGQTQVEGPDDRLGSIYGSVVGKIFEDFYNEKWWQKNPRPVAEMLTKVEGAVAWTIKRETTPYRGRPGGVLMWKGEGEGQNPKGMYVDQDELIEDVKEAIGRGCRVIRHHRLLGEYAEAEVKLDYTVEGYRLGGRADFIIQRVQPHNDLCIIDGKGSRWRAKYVDLRQVLWYAMLYRFHHGVVPDKIGFLFWRYEPNEAIDWVEFVEDDLDELLNKVLGHLRKIEEGLAELGPRPSFAEARQVFRPVAEGRNKRNAEKACRFCRFGLPEICPKGAEVKAKLQEKAAQKNAQRRG